MFNQIRTTKISNIIDAMDNAAYIEQNGYLRKAELNHDGTYTLSHHQNHMPAFEVDHFDTIEELCAEMKTFAPLRNWRQQYNAQGENQL